MSTWFARRGGVALLTFACAMGVSGPLIAAQSLNAVSIRDSAQAPPAGGGGDSWLPIMSPDGRYVLFASTANNLVAVGTNQPLPLLSRPKQNIYLRDRLNQSTVLVTPAISGAGGGNGDSYPIALSTNGQYALFESAASDLVSSDTNSVSDVFLRDVAGGITLLVSAGTNGAVGDGISGSAQMTPDGRWVTFVSAARNLVLNDTNNISDVFVRDMQSGTSVLASVGARPVFAPTGVYNGTNSSENPHLTPDGRFVVFSSTATNLFPGAQLGDIFVRDLFGGITYWVSAGGRAAMQALRNSSAGSCYDPAISDDGQYIAYQCTATVGGNVVGPGLILRYGIGSGITDILSTNAPTEAAYDTLDHIDISADGNVVAFIGSTNGTSGATTCLYVWNALSGTAALASGNISNDVPPLSACYHPTLDRRGNWVAFLSTAAAIVSNSLAAEPHLYLRDLQSNVISRLDTGTNELGLSLGYPTIPCVTPDARFATFDCVDGAAAPDDRNRFSDVFVRDLLKGTNELISVRAASLPTITPNGLSGMSQFSLSADGGVIGWFSDADDVAANDTNCSRDVFARYVEAGSNTLVSISTNGFSGNKASFDVALSADGRFVAFTSAANDLVPGDTNKFQDVFVRDLQSGVTTLASQNLAGTGPGNNDSYAPRITGDGSHVVFRSKATNLAAGSYAGENLFVRDLAVGTNYALTSSGAAIGLDITTDGRYVGYVATNSSSPYVRIWDAQLNHGIYTNLVNGISGPLALNATATRIVYNAGGNLSVTDRAQGTNYVLAATSVAAQPGLRFSADGRWLAYVLSVRTNALAWTNQIYLYDFLGRTNFLVSRAYGGSGAGDQSSDWPDISADGRFVAYRSLAQNLVPGDTNGVADIFLYDRQNGTTTLLSASIFGSASGDGPSLFPVFSTDGQTLVFESWASDLTANDFNQSLNLIAYKMYASGAIPLFSAKILSAPDGQNPTITWPVIPGKSYRLQFKQAITDSTWQETGGGVTILGGTGYFVDPVPAAGARLYRVVAY